MIAFLIIIHIICCLGLILIVLLQAGKGAGLASTFGATAVESALGAGASDFLKKVTTVMAVLFMLTSLSLAFLTARQSASVVRETPASQEAQPMTGPGAVSEEEGEEDKVMKSLKGKSKKELQKVLKEITEKLPLGEGKKPSSKSKPAKSKEIKKTQSAVVPSEPSKPEATPAAVPSTDVSSTGK